MRQRLDLLMMRHPLGRFVVIVLAWLPVCFAIWYFSAPLLSVPMHWLALGVAKAGFGDIILDIEKSGSLFSFVTSLRPASATSFSSRSAAVVVESRSLLYTFGLPLYAALTIAAAGFGNGARPMKLLAIGYVALLPFQTWGIFADALKQVAITMGPAISSQTGFSSFQREVIAFAYQFGTLILPTVIPAVIWVLTQRAFLERMSRDLARGQE